jgi:hypothetical protein
MLEQPGSATLLRLPVFGETFLGVGARASRQRSFAGRVGERIRLLPDHSLTSPLLLPFVLHYRTTTTVLLHLSCRHSFALLSITLRGAMGLS